MTSLPTTIKRRAKKELNKIFDECEDTDCGSYGMSEEGHKRLRKLIDNSIDQTTEMVVKFIALKEGWEESEEYYLSLLLPTQSITDTSKPKEYCQCKASGGTGFVCSICHKTITYN